MMMLVLAFLLVTGLALSPQIAQAELEWKVLQNLDLKSAPLDVAPSTDGQRLFILTPGEILVYSFREGKITDRLATDKGFDRIASLPGTDVLTISSSTKKNLQVVMLESVYKIDVSGLPFQGPRDAPVTIAVFDDYQ
jgi:hypothetical protein